MTRRVQSRHVQAAHTHDVTIAELRVPAHRRVVPLRQAFGEGQVVRMRVRDQHHADGSRPEAFVDGGEVVVVVGTRIDDDRHRPSVDDPGVGARPGVGTRVGRHHALDCCQREGWARR